MIKYKTFLLHGYGTRFKTVEKYREDIEKVLAKILLHCSNINTDSPLTSNRVKLEK